MSFDVILAPEAMSDLRRLRAHDRATVKDALWTYLRCEPRKASRSRIKKLRGMARPQYRLRVGDIRVFYDISERRVEVLGIVRKGDAERWLSEIGERDEESGTF